ncbi:MAG: uncharacterized protein KVP18_002397 [Porospora cf. gigantea A]|nr:MAG: hypothetical protein KVP18_002397 [Porospora cf. gigantea A]
MKKGYPCQLQIRDLYEKYHKLLPTDLACRMTPRDFCAAMVDYLDLPPEDVAYGVSRIFFRFAVLEQLSKVASLSPEDSEVMVANMVDFLKRRKRLRAFAVLKCVVLLDISFRKRRAAVVIARSLKAYAKRRVFQRLRMAAVTIQRHVRGRAQRIRLRRATVAATIIQAHARGYMTRVSYVGLRRLSRLFTRVKHLWRGRKIRQLYIHRRDDVRYLVAFFEAYTERLRLEVLWSQVEEARRFSETRRLEEQERRRASEARRLDEARELEEQERKRASEARRLNEARELEEQERRRASEARRLNEARELEEKEFNSKMADEAIESILADGLEIERRMTAEARQMRESMLNVLASPDDLDQQIACHAEANTRLRVDAGRRQSYAHVRLQQSRRQELGLLTFRQQLKCRAAEFIARQCQLHLNRRPLVESLRTPARRRRVSDPFEEISPIVKQLSSVKRRHGDDSVVMAEWTPQRAVKENKLKQLEEQIHSLSQRNETLCAEKASIQADFNKLQHIKNAVQTEIEQLEKRLEHTRKSELTALEAEAARKREEVAEIGQRTRQLEVRAEKKQAELVRMEHRRKSVGTELRELEAKRLEIDQVIRNLEARRDVEQGIRPSCTSVGRSSGLEVNIHSFNSPSPFQRTSIFGDLTGVRLSNANNTRAETDSPILVFTESAHQSPISAAAHYRRTDLSTKLPLETESQENVWIPNTAGSLYKRFGEAPRTQKTFVNAPVSRGRALSLRRDAPANPPRRRSISRSVTSHPRQNSISRRDSRERVRSSSRCRIGEDYPCKHVERTPVGRLNERAPPRFQTLPLAPSVTSTPSKIRPQPKDARFKSRIRAPSVTKRT